LFVEVKIDKGKQSQSQKDFEAVAMKHGYYYAVVRSIDDCISLIKKFKANEI
jgi:IS4 transposase